MSQYVYVYVRHTHPYSLSSLSCYSSTAAITSYSELMSYPALVNSYGASVYDAYQFQGHTH